MVSQTTGNSTLAAVILQGDCTHILIRCFGLHATRLSIISKSLREKFLASVVRQACLTAPALGLRRLNLGARHAIAAFRGDVSRHGPTPQWRVFCGTRCFGMLFASHEIGNHHSILVALDDRTQEERMRMVVKGRISAVDRFGSTCFAFATTEAGELYAWSTSTRSLVWQASMGRRVDALMSSGSGMVVCILETSVFVFEAETGRLKFQNDTLFSPNPGISGIPCGTSLLSLACSNEILFVGFVVATKIEEEGLDLEFPHVTAMNLESGQASWRDVLFWEGVEMRGPEYCKESGTVIAGTASDLAAGCLITWEASTGQRISCIKFHHRVHHMTLAHGLAALVLDPREHSYGILLREDASEAEKAKEVYDIVVRSAHSELFRIRTPPNGYVCSLWLTVEGLLCWVNYTGDVHLLDISTGAVVLQTSTGSKGFWQIVMH